MSDESNRAHWSGRDVGRTDPAAAATHATVAQQASNGHGSNEIGVGPGADFVETDPNDVRATTGGRGTTTPDTGVEAERVRLDAAMQRADDLLVDSLRRDDSRRRRRRRNLLLLITGAIIMIAITCVVLALLAGQGKNSDEAKDKPDDKAATLVQDGWKLWQERKMSEAEAKFAEAVKLDEKNANAWNGLGWSRFNQGKAKEAVEPFEKAVKIEPDHPAALNGLGQVALFQGKLDVAEKHLLKAAAHDASAAWYGLARLYLLKGDYDRALPWALLVTQDKNSAAGDPTGALMLNAAKKHKLDDDLRKQIEPQPASGKK